MSFWIDTHAHIYAEEFDNDRLDVLARCREVNVNEIFMPNVDHTTIDRMLEAEMHFPAQCFPMMGLHPTSVKKDFERELYIVEEWLMKRKFFAIGEIGTDLYWDKTFWEQQQEAFRIQCAWARKFELPVVIHCRESLDQTIALLESLGGGLTGIFHCFTGTAEQAEKITSLGFCLGIGGVSTFKNGGLDLVLPGVPLDRIVLETDSPYLAPVPFRGKRNDPSKIPLIADRICDLKKVTTQELQTATTANANSVFRPANG